MQSEDRPPPFSFGKPSTSPTALKRVIYTWTFTCGIPLPKQRTPPTCPPQYSGSKQANETNPPPRNASSASIRVYQAKATPRVAARKRGSCSKARGGRKA
ncbi:hypothetical protein NA56DRAFT_647805 [Hyaloscypha hepaticicola]|uniref:Uncharacterized protein n=1 Tax=Hyaloscypha hepaticicola TaxID=2082293 RepID=A0A2J6PX86_9HELO|nr:hypothetical protein NA56DRAFT_647805 [Hyaloscypha hepaticicola]